MLLVVVPTCAVTVDRALKERGYFAIWELSATGWAVANVFRGEAESAPTSLSAQPAV
jgi:hypothetical protein